MTTPSVINTLGQPIGDAVGDWQPASPPPRRGKEGRFCRIEPLDIDRHAADLFAAFGADTDDRIWTYLPYGPFATEAQLRDWMAQTCLGDELLFHAIVEAKTGKAVGVASYLRISPAVGVIEVGHINYSPLLQRTPAATEAMFLMMHRVFSELGYRRYEWKCDALNERSCNAAKRLGFIFEGVFRQATIYKGRNRDTAWFSILDKDWPALEKAYSKWLAAENFDARGQQKKSLAKLIEDSRSVPD